MITQTELEQLGEYAFTQCKRPQYSNKRWNELAAEDKEVWFEVVRVMLGPQSPGATFQQKKLVVEGLSENPRMLEHIDKIIQAMRSI